jgi:sec-independent protein translocase protein TatB
MFDIGWSEMMVIAVIALIIIGPKDLPRVLRSVGHWSRKARALAREFQSGVDEMIREADLEDAKKTFDAAKRMDVDKVLESTVDPTGEVKDAAKSIEKAARQTATGKDESEGKAKDKPKDEAKDAAADGAGDGNGATIIKQPLKVAPPHSVTPPLEGEDAAPAAPAADGKSPEKTA